MNIVPELITPDVEVRFWAKVGRRGDGDCWPWLGCVSGSIQARGSFYLAGKHHGAPRVAFCMASGLVVPRDKVVMHTCDNPMCVNPKHLRLGTQKENIADMWAKGRANTEASDRGLRAGREKMRLNPHLKARGAAHGVHKLCLKGERNGRAKLTESDVRAMRGMAGQKTHAEIAALFGAGIWAVQDILYRRTWKHVQ